MQDRIALSPFSLVYNKLQEMAAANSILQKHIKPGNLVSLSPQETEKASISPADFPELLLIQSGITGGLGKTSSYTDVAVTYNWILTSGSWDLSEFVSELQWGLLTSTYRWCEALTMLTWKNTPFVKNVVLGQVDITVLDSEKNRGVLGWSLDWPLVVYMYFKNEELRSY